MMPAADEWEGDDLVFRCSAASLGCGAVAAAAAAFGCVNHVLALFAPELSWLFLAPSVLLVLVGAVGLCASRRAASQLFRSQLAVFLLVLSGLLTGAGVFSFISTSTVAVWIDEGCEDHRTEGLWRSAGRLEGKMKSVNGEYSMLLDGFHVCRSVDPLVYDLADCGVRAQCPDGRLASEQSLFAFFQSVQLSFACGGFCDAAVPLFGPATMAETLVKRDDCATKIADSVESLGHIFGTIAIVVAIPVVCTAMVLFWAAGRGEDDFGDDEFEEVAGSEPDDESPGYGRGHSGGYDLHYQFR